MSKPITALMSRPAIKKRLIILGILAVACLAIAYPPPANKTIDFLNSTFGLNLGHIEKSFVLGLDLQGGTRLEYEADMSRVDSTERAGALEGVRDVIERRINTLGVSEPLIQTAQVGNAWRVSVELAGIRDVNQAIKLIGETPILEFKEKNTDKPRSLTDEERKKMEEENAATKSKVEKDLAGVIKDPFSLEDLAKTSSSDEASKALGGDLGFIKDSSDYSELYENIKDEQAEKVVPRIIELSNTFVIAQVTEKKDAGIEMKGAHILVQYAGATGAPAENTTSKEDARKKIEDIRKEVTRENFTELAKKYSDEPGANESGGDLGWFGKGVMVAEFEEPALALTKGAISDVVETPFGFHLIYKEDERMTSDVKVRAMFYKKIVDTDIVPPQSEWKNTDLTGKQLERAQLDFDQNTGASQVALQFNDEGSKLFAEITKRNVGQPVAIFLDDQAISIPTVQNEITGGKAVITGDFSVKEAKLLAQRLQSGALPVPIKLIAQQSVGPTLGADSVNKSMKAGIFGFIFVALFMLFWYRLPGLISVISLALYVGLSFSIFKMLPVTLTLAGIAGFILSLGIAVDANVLVFERLKEELKSGKGMRQALEEAFKRAWPSIRDGNSTTLISCAVLYWFSSSIIKGFALTLAIGIIMSLFTTIFVTRTILRFVSGTKLPDLAPWFFLSSTKGGNK
ncbi:MAG: protein translocase subunit SecD [Patescibacteria group bacterium]